ncbi:hypothetical protein EGR_04251 [Echinococcus granulosus]|uniref:Uncharacterized protein n=1 Tax=Echinococcus granulosus TaxID=6210 RepID=W6UR72_ECHGR|nr:hypothetical protein EGR_04251 [Echinococcus granulosus]EUB60812.1 hypothetical protein EGR_04251 [Echinococcus granulosus]
MCKNLHLMLISLCKQILATCVVACDYEAFCDLKLKACGHLVPQTIMVGHKVAKNFKSIKPTFYENHRSCKKNNFPACLDKPPCPLLCKALRPQHLLQIHSPRQSHAGVTDEIHANFGYSFGFDISAHFLQLLESGINFSLATTILALIEIGLFLTIILVANELLLNFCHTYNNKIGGYFYPSVEFTSKYQFNMHYHFSGCQLFTKLLQRNNFGGNLMKNSSTYLLYSNENVVALIFLISLQKNEVELSKRIQSYAIPLGICVNFVAALQIFSGVLACAVIFGI